MLVVPLTVQRVALKPRFVQNVASAAAHAVPEVYFIPFAVQRAAVNEEPVPSPLLQVVTVTEL